MNRLVLVLPLLSPLAARGDEAAVKAALAKPIIGPRQSMLELQDHLEPKIARLPAARSAAEWQAAAARLRQDVLARVVLRGEAAAWKKAKPGVEFLETIPGGE